MLGGMERAAELIHLCMAETFWVPISGAFVKGRGVIDLILQTVLIMVVALGLCPGVYSLMWVNARRCPTLGSASPLR